MSQQTPINIEVKPEIQKLFENYSKVTGFMHTDAAAQLVFAHVLLANTEAIKAQTETIKAAEEKYFDYCGLTVAEYEKKYGVRYG